MMHNACFIFPLLKILGTEKLNGRLFSNSFIFFRTKFHFVTCGAVLFRQHRKQESYAGRLNQFATKVKGMSSHRTASSFCERRLTNMTAAVKVRCCTTLKPQLVKLLFVATPDSDTARSHWLGERGLYCTEARKGFYWFSSTPPALITPLVS